MPYFASDGLVDWCLDPIRDMLLCVPERHESEWRMEFEVVTEESEISADTGHQYRENLTLFVRHVCSACKYPDVERVDVLDTDETCVRFFLDHYRAVRESVENDYAGCIVEYFPWLLSDDLDELLNFVEVPMTMSAQ